MKFLSKLCITAALSISLNGYCQPTQPASSLTPQQSELLSFAYETAKADGHKNPRYFLGILMQESRAGTTPEFRVSGIKDKVFGICQIKLNTALAVMKKWPEMWGFLNTKTNEELQARLILDDKFNVRVASKYVLLMGINDHPHRAIASYNLGPGGAQSVDPKTYSYTVKVKQHAQSVEKYTLAEN